MSHRRMQTWIDFEPLQERLVYILHFWNAESYSADFLYPVNLCTILHGLACVVQMAWNQHFYRMTLHALATDKMINSCVMKKLWKSCLYESVEILENQDRLYTLTVTPFFLINHFFNYSSIYLKCYGIYMPSVNFSGGSRRHT